MNVDAQEGRLSQSNEDYIEAIVELAGPGMQPVRSVDLAAKLEVSKPSVNKALSALKSHGFITQEPYGDILLTEEGRAYGVSVLERHHLLKAFLIEQLGVSPEVAEKEACMMEHSISDDTVKRWARYVKKLKKQ